MGFDPPRLSACVPTMMTARTPPDSCWLMAADTLRSCSWKSYFSNWSTGIEKDNNHRVLRAVSRNPASEKSDDQPAAASLLLMHLRNVANFCWKNGSVQGTRERSSGTRNDAFVNAGATDAPGVCTHCWMAPTSIMYLLKLLSSATFEYSQSLPTNGNNLRKSKERSMVHATSSTPLSASGFTVAPKRSKCTAKAELGSVRGWSSFWRSMSE
mmetsp:Transcript_1658/g.4676  ORF Transcript_1658/g.4676 Transcript_1658/m.4676 type:complete len:212 (-) Transcript_1658:423-1058(-)